MRLLKLFFWSAALVGLGIFLATYRIGGKTPVESATRAWQKTVTPQRLSAVKAKVEDAYEDAKDKVSSSKTPHEHHSAEDRDAVNKLIAKRTPKK